MCAILLKNVKKQYVINICLVRVVYLSGVMRQKWLHYGKKFLIGSQGNTIFSVLIKKITVYRIDVVILIQLVYIVFVKWLI